MKTKARCDRCLPCSTLALAAFVLDEHVCLCRYFAETLASDRHGLDWFRIHSHFLEL
jgi:hypothetical protein